MKTLFVASAYYLLSWKEKSMIENHVCEQCQFWERLAGDRVKGHGDNRIYAGLCHYHPPSPKGFPNTFPEDWCGQFIERSGETNEKTRRFSGT